jgi:hypothetical protein
MLGLLLTFIACREKGPPEGAVRVTVKYGSYRPACLRVVAHDAQGEVGRVDIPQSRFQDPEARQLRVAVFRKAGLGRELTLEVSSFDGSSGEECSGSLVEQLSSQPILVPLEDFASFEATLRAKDDDGDNFIAREEGVKGTDCDDRSGEVFPGAAERCSVAVDYDCDGARGCQDSKCQQKACDDGNACTTGDRCEGSGVSAQCTGQAVRCEKPASGCFTASTCSQETGQCVNTRKACDTPPTACYESAGTCNDATGQCEYAAKAASVSCDDSQACTTGDACNGAGVCQGTQTPCTPSSICFRVTGGCAALGNCTEAPDSSKVNAACTLAGGTGTGVCRASDGKCSRFPYVPSNFDPDAIPPASILPLTTTCAVTFDSTTLSWTPQACVSNPPTPIELSQGNGMVLFALSNVNLGGDLRLVGNRPVILAVYGNATLDHDILAHGEGTAPGAGGSLASACVDRRGRGGVFSSSLVGGGGGGAGGGTTGAAGAGGTDSGSTPGDGGNAGGDVFAPLVGGCSGGSGGGDALGGAGGAGGGAVQLSVAGTLTVNQQVSASAGGGGGGMFSTSNGGQAGGGGGGGSGGQVLLEAHQLNLGASGRLTANGGGGGEGSGYHSSAQKNGKEGADGSLSTAVQAAGGTGSSQAGGAGGSGGVLGKPPGAGTVGDDVNAGAKGGGGGGGGAVGHIRLRSVRSCSINGSSIISPAANTQCPL